MGFATWGRDLPQLFARAAGALFALITDLHKIKPEQCIHTRLEAAAWPELLVDWLSEILYLQQVQNMLFARAQVMELAPYRLQACLWGEKFDPARHYITREIKGITYHRLSLEQDEKGQWRLQVIVDI